MASSLISRSGGSSIMRSSGRHAGIINLIRICLSFLCHSTVSSAHPLFSALSGIYASGDEPAKAADDPSLYIYLGTALALVLLGGVFAGLTIALMGQDEIYLQVIATSGEDSERRNATKVLKLLKKGKHWVLVTLLVSNVVTNETLPIVLDRSLGGGYAAAITSAVLVIIFGEIVPQSACVRYGLPIGAWTSPFVLAAMWITCPISWPIAKLLDWILGKDHGTTYNKGGLKTLVTLHKTLGSTPADRLNQDEVLIISGVLDLKAKSVGSIMTPMSDVFTLSADAVLDEDLINNIMREGYSRIPIHSPNNEHDFVGMLLVKILITYDPEDCRRVSEFSLATLPETMPDTSCLDIINFFQEGKSHMVLVSENPGGSYGALGVVTLEDVIEELIGEEIIDESDVFVDVHKAIRRMTPAPTHRMRHSLGELAKGGNSFSPSRDRRALEKGSGDCAVDDEWNANGSGSYPNHNVRHHANGAVAVSDKRLSSLTFDEVAKPKSTTFLMRRKSSGEPRTVQMDYASAAMKENLRSLGPSNVASRPRPTRVTTVKIKPGVSTGADVASQHGASPRPSRGSISTPPPTNAQEGIGKNLVTANHEAADGVHAVQAGYGTWDHGAPWKRREGDERPRSSSMSVHSHGTQTARPKTTKRSDTAAGSDPIPIESDGDGDGNEDQQSTVGSLRERSTSPTRGSRWTSKPFVARSGSIQEKSVESGSVKKLVLELTSSSEEADEGPASSRAVSHSRNNSRTTSLRRHGVDGVPDEDDEDSTGLGAVEEKKKRKKRPKRKKNHHHRGGNHLHNEHDEDHSSKGAGDERTPLLG